MYADIVPLRKTGEKEIFTYKIPASFQKKAKEGAFVEIPFGQKTTKGVILHITSTPPAFPTKEIKNILSFPPLFSWQIELALWISKNYLACLGKTFSLFAPPFLKSLSLDKIAPFSLFKKQSQKLSIPPLTFSQKKAFLKMIQEKLTLFPPQNFLLYTPFYEEKWPLYLNLAIYSLKQKEQILFIFPEKSHLKKAEVIFKKRKIPYISFHGDLKNQEKLAIFKSVAQEKTGIILGLKSALFLPFSNLKNIVVDEEENESYKEEREPQFEVPTVALQMGKILKAKVILQSSLISINAFWKFHQGELVLIKIHKKRSYKTPLIKIIDLRKEKKQSQNQFLTKNLKKEIDSALKNKKKIILYLERKGFTTIICEHCQYIFRCPSCQKPLIFIKENKQNFLFCPICQIKKNPPDFCPKCKGVFFAEIGGGIEKLALEIKKNFPHASFVRIDSSVIKNEKQLLEKEKEIKKKKPQIILTTRLIFSFSQIEKSDILVFVLPEINFNLPDFKIEEKTLATLKEGIFHLLKRKKGKVFIQTYLPRHPLFKSLINPFNFAFHEFSLKERKKLLLPPFTQLVKLSYSSTSNQKTQKTAEETVEKIKNFALKKKLPLSISGPFPGFFDKIKRRQPLNILIKIPANFSLEILSPILKKFSSSWKKEINPPKLF